MKKRKEEMLRLIAAALIFGVVLSASLFMGENERAKQQTSQEQQNQTAVMRPPTDHPPILTQKQAEVLRRLKNAMEKENWNVAAIVLKNNEDWFVDLFYTDMNGERYLFNGEKLQKELDGTGLVLTMPGTVFFGEFKKGYPEGQCSALQFVHVDEPRYQYSSGQWHHGKMNGQGKTGYCYFRNVPEGEVRESFRQGNFKDDFLDGTIVYESTGSRGLPIQWEMNCKDGVIVPDENWTYLEEEDAWQLMAKDEKSHAYVLSSEQLEQPIGVNGILWEE